jgi:hypothetical protein
MASIKQQLAVKKEGRPTKYIPETIYPKIEEYISSCGKEQTELPTVEGLALYLGVNADTLFEWSKQYPEFSESIKKILMKQKTQLMNDGMYGGKEVNAGMAIFLLKCNHGMNDGSNANININEAKILVLPTELITKYGITPDTKTSS